MRELNKPEDFKYLKPGMKIRFIKASDYLMHNMWYVGTLSPSNANDPIGYFGICVTSDPTSQYFKDPAQFIGQHYIIQICEEVVSNKGQKKCLSCNCPTEMKRDFSNMEVREFCPRCRR